jgi:hypothetical protein
MGEAQRREQADFLVKVLNKRFGVLPQEVEGVVLRASAPELLAIAERSYDARSIQDLARVLGKGERQQAEVRSVSHSESPQQKRTRSWLPRLW